MFKQFSEIDKTIIIVTFLLIIVGFGLIYSTTYQSEGQVGENFKRQIIWFIIGFIGMIGTIIVPLRMVHSLAYIFYGFTIFLLVLVLFMGISGYGATRWLLIGPIRIQPSELAKIGTIIALARFLSDRNRSLSDLKNIGIAFGIVLLPMMLIFVEPDLGTSLVFAAMLLPVLFWAGLPLFTLFVIVTPFLSILCAFNFYSFLGIMIFVIAVLYLSRRPAIISAPIFLINIGVGIITEPMWDNLKPYQRQRILTFLNPETDAKGAGYQVIQSKTAIGSGGMTGKGYLHGSQTQLRFLPAQHTDFIFSVLAEEFGFIGVSAVLFLFLVLVLRILHLAASVNSRFFSLIVAGIGATLVFHIFVNIGMITGMMPVTGLPLPFLSYGGSFLTSNMIMIGLILNISMHRLEY